MRDGLAVSVLGHAALLAWGLLSLPAPKALDASTIEAIPVNFVKIAEVTSIPKGVDTPKRAEKPKPAPPKTAQEKPQPKPEPKPPEPAPVTPPPKPPEPTPPKAQPEPTPAAPPPEKTAPEPKPEPKPEPPPPQKPPPPAKPKPAETAKPMPKDVPVPRPAPRMVAETPKKKPPDTFNADRIAALLNKDAAAPKTQNQQPSLGGTTPAPAAPDAQLTATELDALRARLAECWTPPIGWTDPSEVRVVIVLSLNPDGSVAGDPQILERPAGRYAQTAPESVLRAVRRCAPYTLPPDQYELWKQVKITFDPVEMGGGGG